MSWLDKVAATAIRVEALTDKVEIVSQAIEAASACSETLTEWLWLLEGEDALAASSDNLEPTWLIEDGVLPERFQGPTANMATSARSLFKQLSLLSDALGEARKDKGGEAAQVDKTASDLGFLTARAEQLLAVWELFEKKPSPPARPSPNGSPAAPRARAITCSPPRRSAPPPAWPPRCGAAPPAPS